MDTVVFFYLYREKRTRSEPATYPLNRHDETESPAHHEGEQNR